MTTLSPEEHERLQAENAKKIEAIKLTMAEPSTSKGKRAAVFLDPAAPPKKRGRPKGVRNISFPEVHYDCSMSSIIHTQSFN
ncbi:unnamed protein product [Strongylus vulgaris]|uniref:Uncharacterized protein n=1 Tax=Strongylus vulgaris TaxID=40348 RepID=A0A3P7K5H4_STRVU|nr:unnamed protein product [Strongylus vulgaris]